MNNSIEDYKPYNVVKGVNTDIFMWTREVPVESGAIDQLRNLTSMPFVFKHVAAMPDVHVGIGATVGTVFATVGAVIPAAVGGGYWLWYDCVPS